MPSAIFVHHHLATIDMGRWGDLALLWEGELGPHLRQSRLRRDLPPGDVCVRWGASSPSKGHSAQFLARNYRGRFYRTPRFVIDRHIPINYLVLPCTRVTTTIPINV